MFYLVPVSAHAALAWARPPVSWIVIALLFWGAVVESRIPPADPLPLWLGILCPLSDHLREFGFSVLTRRLGLVNDRTRPKNSLKTGRTYDQE